MSHKRDGGRGVKSLPLEWTKQCVTTAVLRALQDTGFLSRDVSALIGTSVDPAAFYTAESFRRAYWQSEMFRKYPFNIKGVDRKQEAITAFLAAEQQCGDSNRRLHDLFNKASIPEAVRRVFDRARRDLADLFEGFTLDEVAEHCRWGPGASTSLKAAISTASNKWVYGHHITQDAVPYLEAFTRWSGWAPFITPKVVRGNTVTTVPKNSKTDRTIAIEPDWNMFFQLGLGGAIRHRLQKRRRCLLRCAQEIQQTLAQRGSLNGDLATVDLSMASDTISMALVEELLPQPVVRVIKDLRSPSGTLDGESWFPYEKVSSMGNGFTFELESAIFLALARAACGHATAYGDDLVVPSTSVGWLLVVLEYAGFTVNTRKTHYASMFRESCGGHFFGGVDVTPVYIDEPLRHVTRLAKLNQLIAAEASQVLPELKPAILAGSSGIPRLFCGPEGVDGVLHVPFDKAQPRWDRRRQTHVGKRILLKHMEDRSCQIGGLRASLFGRQPSQSSHERKPGIPKLKVADWYSGAYRPVPPDGLRDLSPLIPRWKGGAAV